MLKWSKSWLLWDCNQIPCEQDAWKDRADTHVYQQTVKTPEPDSRAIFSIAECVSKTTIQCSSYLPNLARFKLCGNVVKHVVKWCEAIIITYSLMLLLCEVWSIRISQELKRRNKSWPIDRAREALANHHHSCPSKWGPKAYPNLWFINPRIHHLPAPQSLMLPRCCYTLSRLSRLSVHAYYTSTHLHIYTSHKHKHKHKPRTRNHLGTHSQRRRSQSHSQFVVSIQSSPILR